jgi:hypothetical protein
MAKPAGSEPTAAAAAATNPYADAPAFPLTIGEQPQGMPLHACMGLNACAGSDRFGKFGPPGGQPNACAGQGYCSTTADHSCHVQNHCANQGGCGLYGTAEEMDNPGSNACRSLGSCATPINGERFSTNGPNQGRSVWARARRVFEEKVWTEVRAGLLEDQSKGAVPNQPLPQTLGRPPADFATTGPTYMWITGGGTGSSGDVSSCGASGLSGAGGCA